MRTRILIIIRAGTILFAIGSLVAQPARADGPIFTTVTECFVTPDPGGGISTQPAGNKATISPSGRAPSEDLPVRVEVRNVLGAALPGASVTVTAVPRLGAIFRWDDGQLPPGDTAETPPSNLTDATGVAEVIFDEGGAGLPALP